MTPDDSVERTDLPGGDGPLPNRFTRSTLMGCLGLCCVLALPAVFFLPLEAWGDPFWMQLLAPLVAFGAVALGVALLARVPAGAQFRSSDPRFPLTGAGALPMREAPATRANRVALGVAALLVAWALAGVLLALWSGAQEPMLVFSVLASGLAGVLLTLDGALVATWRAPIPAWRWVRAPVQSRRAPRGISLALAGLAVTFWALLIVTYAGFSLGALALTLLVIACVFAAPISRRISWRQSPPSSWSDAQQYPIGDDL